MSPPPLREPSLKQPHSTLYRRRASLCCYRSGREFSIPQLPIHHLDKSGRPGYPTLPCNSDGLANVPRLLGRAPVSVPCSILDPRCFSSVICCSSLWLSAPAAPFVKRAMHASPPWEPFRRFHPVRFKEATLQFHLAPSKDLGQTPSPCAISPARPIHQSCQPAIRETSATLSGQPLCLDRTSEATNLAEQDIRIAILQLPSQRDPRDRHRHVNPSCSRQHPRPLGQPRAVNNYALPCI